MNFEPQNELERILAAAVHDPSRRGEFYRELERAELYTVHMGGELPVENGELEEKTTVRLPSVDIEGKSYLPVFSSLLELQRFIDREMQYLSMNAMDLFGLVRGSDVWLNPGGEFGKEFPAAEIEAILDGAIYAPPQSYTVEQETQVMLGRPSKEPRELLEELERVFDSMPNVNLAYHAHYYNPETGDPPHTLIAIESDDGWNEVVQAAGRAAGSAHVPDPPVDFLQLDGVSGLERYFERECEPFYRKRKRRGFFAR
ncbi:enhanced serine sensitivity protein SseB C-terminal domain-containing protein [Saccharibacillus sp. CPCC 101409]|uniref:enhanced serine sensitivity protein SseB C-terminal domain-containing protein n=1 Tax=Saccharibacillus sp. CPCC 101409 TaxID=3058041 RepID=UPI0026735D2C|nr:enhanced serine sensitivity protein SseB C-terminal domain-containing protein [Saccharibacillus sp. CPCC 101409]MDO3410460.1 enhanced serine sensitivity protein SseB C-terminal domain-containing protein [Saccharibacillus sp. CPCC 101409]